jgi:hypothetical protein
VTSRRVGLQSGGELSPFVNSRICLTALALFFYMTNTTSRVYSRKKCSISTYLKKFYFSDDSVF